MIIRLGEESQNGNDYAGSRYDEPAELNSQIRLEFLNLAPDFLYIRPYFLNISLGCKMLISTLQPTDSFFNGSHSFPFIVLGMRRPQLELELYYHSVGIDTI